MNLNITHKLYILLASSILLFGCIKEDLSRCKFQLLFQLDSEGFTIEDIVGTNGYVNLYIFDSQNKFIELRQITAKEFASSNIIEVPDYFRNKNMVVWAVNGLGDYEMTDMSLCDDMNKLIVKLKTDNGISSKKLVSLFYGGNDPITFPENNNTFQIINFVRANNIIKTSIKGNDGESVDIESIYDVRIRANNTQYATDFSIIKASTDINYLPFNFPFIETKQSDSKTAQMETLRMVTSDVDNFCLRVVHRATGKLVTFGGEDELKLIEYFLRSIPEGEDAQKYLDKGYVWDVSLNISTSGSIVISMVVNGWIYIFNNSDLN